MEFCDAIREVRTRLGETRRGLGRKVGYDQSAISRFELGHRQPTIHFLLAMDPHLTNDERVRILQSVGFDLGFDPVVLEVQRAMENPRWSHEKKKALSSAIRTMLRSS